jgi:anhydro-N-acetylmuramic acid kinase
VIGLMSGTSADGIDAAMVEVEGWRPHVLAFRTYPYPTAVREAVLDLCAMRLGIDELCHLNFVLGELFATAAIQLADRAGVPMASVDLIGSHGQTVYHIPVARPWRRGSRRRTRSTLQIGEPCVIAQRTGVTTVADFRTRDVAAGGQGAPLVPLADWMLFGHAKRNRAVQNIGGIANVTYLPAGGGVEAIRAFDTGPGNMVIDGLVRRITLGRSAYDVDGKLAAQGKVHQSLLSEWMRHPYFTRRPPKTTGREEFGREYADNLYRRALAVGLDERDLLATATALTATSIAQAYRKFLKGKVDEAILCGGGARNDTLVGMLREQLNPIRVILTDDLGIDADAKEAVSFALLACRTIRGLAGNVPGATGAKGGVVLGKIVPGGACGR